MMMSCYCGETAKSHFYDVEDPWKFNAIKEAQAHQELNSLDNPMPHLIWFKSRSEQDIIDSVNEDINLRPALASRKKELLAGTRDHARQGGLLLLYTPRFTQAAAQIK